MVNIASIVIMTALFLVNQVQLYAAEDSDSTSATESIFVELKTDTLSPYVQAQVLVTVRLFREASSFDAAMSQPRLSEPMLGSKAMLRLIDTNTRKYRLFREGKIYVVTEREYTLYPEASGSMQLGPVIFQGQIVKGGTISFVEAKSKVIDLDVRPIPETFDGSIWIPARSVELYQDFQPREQSIELGKPISRNLFLSATGLGSGHIPSFTSPKIPGFRVHPRMTERNELEHAEAGLIAVLQQEIVLVPTAAGLFEIPPIKVPWWNTIEDKMEIAYYPGVSLEILPANEQQLDTTDYSSNGEQTGSSISEVEPGDIYISEYPILFSLAGIVLFIAALLLLSVRFNGKRKINTNKISLLFNKAMTACRNNKHQDAEHAIIELADNVIQGLKIRSLEQFAQCTGHGLAEELYVLNRHNYTSEHNVWNGERMLVALRLWKKNLFHKPQGVQHDLPELYPLSSGR